MKRLLERFFCGWLALWTSFSLLLAGCAGLDPAPAPPTALFADSRFAPPSEAVDAADLFTLSPAMRAYLDSPAFQERLRAKGSRHGLVDALYSQTDLKLEYDSTNTRNARETYAARIGNCLSLVVMTAAFAKELGMPVQYQSVSMDHLWSRSNGLYLASSHINISLGPNAGDVRRGHDPRQMLTVGFLAREDAARLPENLAVLRNLEPLLTALGRPQEAQLLAKRIAGIEPVPPYHWFDQGVAALKAGRNERALELFEREVRRAPYNDEFRFWLGMAYLRAGNVSEAREHIALTVDHSTQRDMRELYAAKLAQLRQVASHPTRLR
ncbi:c-type cytochrome biogenesis protein [Massilia sp. YIM B02443]|uniref:tetratricopeptide repeat protein n=1 Tax=Massilia sp. YIM B02443 TaxID=3050127 RepID=UPI0025B6C648|nr:tetratricopeptide repeat protein [Massilia sp. YIM B02443]MDN4036841.1 tetratricopeptide repeat protein [Massilia sp. YIM B02443]